MADTPVMGRGSGLTVTTVVVAVAVAETVPHVFVATSVNTPADAGLAVTLAESVVAVDPSGPVHK